MIVVNTAESFRGKPIRFYYKVTDRIPVKRLPIRNTDTMLALFLLVLFQEHGTGYMIIAAIMTENIDKTRIKHTAILSYFAYHLEHSPGLSIIF